MGNIFDLEYFIAKAEREYLLNGKTEFSYSIRLTEEIRTNVRKFEDEISRHLGIEVTAYTDRRINDVKVGIPSQLRFSENYLFKLRPGLRLTAKSFAGARDAARYLNIDIFLRSHFAEAKKKHLKLESAVRAVEFILEHRPTLAGLFPRQVPHGQSTKLLMEDTLARRLLAYHYGRPQLTQDDVRELFGFRKKPSYFHFHANRISYDGVELSNHHAVVTESNLHRFDFSNMACVVVVENAEVFHAALGKISGMIILGDGDKAASLSFLEPALQGVSVYYWGDIDKDGYEAFEAAREGIPHIRPIAMDMDSINRYFHLNQKQQPQEPIAGDFSLAAEYLRVCREGIRIEQEQLPLAEILTRVQSPSGTVVDNKLFGPGLTSNE